MASSPDGPGDDAGRLDLALGQSAGQAADFLDGPSHHRRQRSAGRFWGAMTAFARWRITASRAKASMTSETWRCQPCQLRVSLWSSPLGGLEAVLDRPAATFGTDQGLDGRALRAPGGQKGQALVGEAASDEQAARPQAMAARIALSLCLEVRQLQI